MATADSSAPRSTARRLEQAKQVEARKVARRSFRRVSAFAGLTLFGGTLLSGFLGFFYWLFGPNRTTADVVNTTVGALLAPATFALARKALGRTRATIAGLLVTVHPGLVLYSVLVMSGVFWIACSAP